MSEYHSTPVPGPAAQLQNVEGEAALLGMLLMDNSRADMAADLLKADDFYEGVHGAIYQAILDSITFGRAASPVSLRPVFEHDERFKTIGGAGYLAQLTGSGASMFINLREQCAQIAELAARRRLIESLKAATENVYNLETTLQELVDESDAALIAAVERRDPVHQPTGAEAIGEAIERIRAIQRGETGLGAMTGIRDFDELTGGLEAGQVMIIGGRPGMGKTAVLCSGAVGLARNGFGVAIFSLEMEAVELGMRMASDLCSTYHRSIPFSRIVAGDMSEAEMVHVETAQKAMAHWPMRIIDKGGLTISRLSMLARRHKRRMAAQGQILRVIFIDYLQLLRPDKRGQSVYETTSEISRELKILAKELGVAIVALAQLNREVEKREDKRPQLADLRDSGQIEQDADIVMFLYREEYYLEKNEPKDESKKAAWQDKMDHARNRLELLMPKRRNGPSGKRTCWYFASSQAVRGNGWHQQ